MGDKHPEGATGSPRKRPISRGDTTSWTDQKLGRPKAGQTKVCINRGQKKPQVSAKDDDGGWTVDIMGELRGSQGQRHSR